MSNLSEYASTSDEALLAAIRSGNMDAYSELWSRYRGAGFHSAQSFTSSFDAEDLVAEAHSRILRALQSGKGPTTGFRAYLIATIRNVARTWGQADKETTVENLDVLFDAQAIADFSEDALDKLLIQRAFRSLSARWRQVLWVVDVEDGDASELSRQLGIKANAVGSLVYRAREGLKQAYISAHLDANATGSECRDIIHSLAAFERGALTARGMKRVEAHLAACESCPAVRAESNSVAQRLRAALPATILAGGLAAYATFGSLGSSSASAASLAQTSLSAGTKGAVKGFFTWSPKMILSVAASATLVGGVAVASTAVLSPPPAPESSAVESSGLSPVQDPTSASGAAAAGEKSTKDSSATPASTVVDTDPLNEDSAHQIWKLVSNGGPAAPVFAAPAGTIFHGSEAAVEGTALPGAAVTLYLSGSGNVGGQVKVSTVTANEAGGWTFPLVNPAEGEYVARAYQLDSSERRSPLSSTEFGVQWDIHDSPPVVSKVDSDSGRLAPIVSGTGIAGNTVVVSLNGVATSQRIASDGTWSVLASRGSLVGTNTITVLQRSPRTHTQSLSAEPVSFDLTLPSVILTAESTDTLLITVQSHPGSNVLLADGQGLISHEIAATKGTDTLRFTPTSNGASLASLTKMKVRYASADGSRVGPSGWQKL